MHRYKRARFVDLALIAGVSRELFSVNSDRVPLQLRAVVRSSQQSDATAVFRSARDLITDGEWARAQEKFDEYVKAYPNEKNIEAALYWLAYTQHKLAKYDQCRSTIDASAREVPEHDAGKTMLACCSHKCRAIMPLPLQDLAEALERAGRRHNGPAGRGSCTLVYAPGRCRSAPVAVTPVPAQGVDGATV